MNNSKFIKGKLESLSCFRCFRELSTFANINVHLNISTITHAELNCCIKLKNKFVKLLETILYNLQHKFTLMLNSLSDNNL